LTFLSHFFKIKKEIKMSLIYMIRHAQASFGKPDYDQLSEMGLRQSKTLAGRLHQASVNFDAIYTGLLLRHEQTAAAYLEVGAKAGKSSPPVYKNEAFNEYDSEKILTAIIPVLIQENPAFETEVSDMFGGSRSFQRVLEKVMGRWVMEGATIEGVGTWKDYAGRVNAAIDDIMETQGADKNLAVFTSGGPIAVTVQKALNLSNEQTLKILWQIVNTSITRFKYSGRRLALFGFNDFSHLESAGGSGLITYR
jgi:broad specificity phosphatase PhoE